MARLCYINKTFWTVKRRLMQIGEMTEATDNRRYRDYLHDLVDGNKYFLDYLGNRGENCWLYFEKQVPVALITCHWQKRECIDRSGHNYASEKLLRVLERAVSDFSSACSLVDVMFDIAESLDLELTEIPECLNDIYAGSNACERFVNYCLRTNKPSEHVNEILRDIFEDPDSRSLARKYMKHFDMDLPLPKPHKFIDVADIEYKFTEGRFNDILEITKGTKLLTSQIEFHRFVTLKPNGDIVFDLYDSNVGKPYAMIDIEISGHRTMYKDMTIITDGEEWHEIAQENGKANIRTTDNGNALDRNDQRMIKRMVSIQVDSISEGGSDATDENE